MRNCVATNISVYVILDLGGSSLGIYVGITSKPISHRLSLHRRKPRKSNKKTAWIKSIEKQGRSPTIHLLESCHDWQAACEREKFWIAKFKLDGLNVKNMTLGGDGRYGVKLSEDHKRKIGLTSTGRSPSQETRAKISNFHRGRVATRETREKISRAKIGKPGRKIGAAERLHLRQIKTGKLRPGIRVVCVSTGEIFDSITKAAISCGADRILLAKKIRSGKNCGFRYVDHIPAPCRKTGLRGRKFSDGTKNKMSISSAMRRAVRHVPTGQLFRSITSAASAFGVKFCTLSAQLSRGHKSDFEYAENSLVN